MPNATPRYYVVKQGRWAYWQPRKKDIEEYGVAKKSLGEPGFAAMALAEEENKKLDALRMRAYAPRKEASPYKRGTLGKFYWRWTHRPAYYKLGVRTREEIETAWKRIGPRFGHKKITSITVDDLDEFHMELDEEATEYVRWRTMRKLNQILTAAAGYPGVLPERPISKMENPKPDGRSQIYLPHEIQALIDTAEAKGWANMRLCIELMYEAALSPVDARTLTLEMLKGRQGERYIERERMKVQGRSRKRPGVMADISDALYDALMDHAHRDGRTPLPTATLFISDDTGSGWRGEDHFSKDFRIVRDEALPGEDKRPRNKRRAALDIRRTANKEAEIGGATKEQRAKLLANSIDTNEKLHATYTPPDVLSAQKTSRLRAEGRKLLSEHHERNTG